MKKKSIIIGIVLSVIVVGIALFRISASNVSASITMEEAKSLAQAQFPGEVVEIEFEKMGSKAVYEVKIVGQGKSYELWLDGNTGEVLRLEEKASFSSNVEVEAEGSVSNNSNSDNPQTSDDNESSSNGSSNDQSENTTKVEGESEADVKTETNGSTDSQKDDQSTGNQGDDSKDDQGNSGGILNLEVPILKEAAIEIALNEINVNGTIKEIELDDDDGRLYYEIELYTDTHEIDMEIDAYTGEVLSISTEYED
jgi:uncharacterized membrane protein YkoI